MIITIDAGHYGTRNQSPAYLNYFESVQMWKLSQMLGEELKARGCECRFTRTNQQTDLSLFERGAKAKGSQLFLSLHSNACGSESTDYPLIIEQLNKSAEPIGKLLGEGIERVMGTKGNYKIISKQGTSGDYYGVLRGATSVNVPGLIIEHSFHTNKKMAEWLNNDNNLRKLAEVESDIISDYYNTDVQTDFSVPISKDKEINDIIWELSQRKIISNSQLWLKKVNGDDNLYWLLKKVREYMGRKGV